MPDAAPGSTPDPLRFPPPPADYEWRRGKAPRTTPEVPDSWARAASEVALGHTELRRDSMPLDGPTEDGSPPPVGSGFQRQDLFRVFGIASAVFIVLFLLGVGAFTALTDDPSENVETVGISLIVIMADLAALVVVPIVLLGGRARASALLGLRRPGWAVLGWGFLALIGSYIALGVYLGIVDAIGADALEPVSTVDRDESFTIAAAVIQGIAVILVAPFAEEIFHRGFMAGAIQGIWGRGAGTVAAVVISAALFSVLHFDVGSLIPFFLIGAIFALVHLRSRNLYSSILAHLAFNLISFTVFVADQGIA